jgi:hypothetical protein
LKQTDTPRWRGGLIFIGALLYLIFLIVQMPAAWLIARIPEDSPVRLQQASGGPWSGKVASVVWRVDAESIELGALNWRWLPGELLGGRIGFQLDLGREANSLGGIVLLEKNGWSVKNLRGPIDARVLGFASRAFGLLQPQGSLMLDIASLHHSTRRIHGAASVDWLGARSGLVAAPLGDYSVQLNSDPDGRRAHFEIRTLQAGLSMDGAGEYFPGKSPQGMLRLKPPAGEGGNVYRPLLNILGRPNAGGEWVLSFTPR